MQHASDVYWSIVRGIVGKGIGPSVDIGPVTVWPLQILLGLFGLGVALGGVYVGFKMFLDVYRAVREHNRQGRPWRWF